LAIGRSGASDELASPALTAATSGRVASSRSTIVAVGAVLGFIVIVGGVLAAVKMTGQPSRTAAPAQSAILAAAPASANVSPPAPSLTSPATVAPAAHAPAPTPSAAAPAPSGAASVATASGSAPAVDESGGDGSDLPNNQGYLIVTSNSDADVYVTGIKVGVTNAKNKAACHMKWVRLGRGAKTPSWISKGQTVNVKCQQVTRVEMQQDPHPEK
jgi:serine/threonine-protein kinase